MTAGPRGRAGGLGGRPGRRRPGACEAAGGTGRYLASGCPGPRSGLLRPGRRLRQALEQLSPHPLWVFPSAHGRGASGHTSPK